MQNKIIFLLLVLVTTAYPSLFAQSPQAMNYQAVVRKNTGIILQNQSVSFRIGILQGSATGTNVFTETQTTTTNDYGLVNLALGTGTLVSGNFSTIDWSNGPYFIELEMDENGGTNFLALGTSQLLSVPYALYAETSGGAAGDNDQDSTNELQTLTQVGTDVTLSDGGGTISVADNDADSTNELQDISLNGTDLTISSGSTVDLSVIQDGVTDADADPTNEIQVLSTSNDTLYLSNGGSIFLGTYLDDTDQQTLTRSNDTIFISNGNFIVLPVGQVDTDDQTLSISNDSLFIQDGNSVDLSAYAVDNVNDADADPTNEIQVLSTSNDTLYLSNGGSIFLGTYLDDTDTDQQTLTRSNDTIFISNGNFIVLPTGQVDTDDQTLSISNDSLFIQDGNSVDLSAYAVDNVNDADADPTNEIQVLSTSNDTLYLSNGGSIFLGTYLDDTDTDQQTLTRSNDTIFISNGNFIVLPTGQVDTDDQTLSISNDSLFIQDGNSVDLSAYAVDNVNDADADPTNEIQAISLSNDTLFLSNGGFAVLPPATVNTDDQDLTGATLTGSDLTIDIENGSSVTADLSALEESAAIAQVASDLASHELADNDLDASNELQTLSQAGNNVTLSDGGGTISVADDDNDPNNEIQTLTFSNDTLFLSDGGTVDLSNYTNTDTQTLSLSGDTLAISNGNNVLLYDHPIEMTGVTPAHRQIKNVSDPTDSTDVVNAQTLQWGSLIYGMANGTTDTFAVNVAPAVTQLRPGTTIMFKANHDIAGTTALDLNGLGPIPVKKNVSDDLVAGEILNGQMVQVVYDGTNWQVGAGSLSTPTGGSSGGGDGACYTCDGF